MIVFKGFNKDMTCTMGRGTFEYQLGKKATANKAKTVSTGLHSTREPFGILRYYGELGTDVHCICEAGGDISEDEDGRVASTELTPLQKLTPQQLAMYEAVFVQKHPEICATRFRERETDNGFYAIARGKNPEARGKRGTVVILLQEYARSKKIKQIEAYNIDGKANRAGWYKIGGYLGDKGEAEET